MKVVVLISANAEWGPVRMAFPQAALQPTPYGDSFEAEVAGFRIRFFQAGWGKSASAGGLQYALDHFRPDLVINLGTCGGLAGVVGRGEIVLVERTFIYDIVELMDPADVTGYYATTLDLSWLPAPEPFPVRRGLVVSADGDLLPERVAQLSRLGALAADWESASLAWVAQKNGARLLILRAVSDVVSAEGGELYDQIELFNERTAAIMRQLLEQLPGWLRCLELP